MFTFQVERLKKAEGRFAGTLYFAVIIGMLFGLRKRRGPALAT
jgi:hypothetical protein